MKDLKLKKDGHILVRVNQRVKEKFKVLADSKGKTMSEMIDDYIEDTFKSEGVKLTVDIF